MGKAISEKPSCRARTADTSTTIRTQNMDTTDFRVDHRFDNNNSLFARYSYNRVNTFTPGACPIVNGIDPNCIVGGIAAGGAFPGPNHTTASNVVASYVKVFNPSLIGEFKGSYNHPDINSLPANYGKNLGTQFGIPNTNVDALTSGMPCTGRMYFGRRFRRRSC